MPRVKRGPHRRASRKKTLHQASGYFLTKSKLHRAAQEILAGSTTQPTLSLADFNELLDWSIPVYGLREFCEAYLVASHSVRDDATRIADRLSDQEIR